MSYTRMRRCSLGKCKSTPRPETASHPLGHLFLGNQKLTSVSEDADRGDPRALLAERKLRQPLGKTVEAPQ